MKYLKNIMLENPNYCLTVSGRGWCLSSYVTDPYSDEGYLKDLIVQGMQETDKKFFERCVRHIETSKTS